MTGWIVETLIATTVLMLLVLALRGPVARRFGPQIAYALWLLPALRMVLPPLPESVAPAPMAALPHVLQADHHLAALLAAAQALPAMPEAAPAGWFAGMDWPTALLVAWLAGAALFFAAHVIRYWRFLRRVLGGAEQLPRLDRDGIEVCASPLAPGPFAAGIFLKAIVLPLDWRKRYAPDELRLALEHEAAHHRRCDMSANLAALAMLALHWWNPIAHRAHRAFRVDQELACDAIVLAGASPGDRQAYGSALLKSACDRLPVAACALGAGEDLKRRLRMMAFHKPDPRRRRIGALIAGGCVLSGLALTASGGIAAETGKQVEARVRTALLAPPVPPVPVVPAAAAVPPAPEAPEAPEPPMPATEAEAEAWIDAREIAAEMAEVRAEAAEAAAEAAEAAAEAIRDIDVEREVAAELRREMPRIRAEIRHAQAEVRDHARAVSASCGKGQAVWVRTSSDGDGKSWVKCGELSAAERAEMRRQIIQSLEQARDQIASQDGEDWGRRARQSAIAALDRQLERLRRAQ